MRRGIAGFNLAMAGVVLSLLAFVTDPYIYDFRSGTFKIIMSAFGFLSMAGVYLSVKGLYKDRGIKSRFFALLGIVLGGIHVYVYLKLIIAGIDLDFLSP